MHVFMCFVIFINELLTCTLKTHVNMTQYYLLCINMLYFIDPLKFFLLGNFWVLWAVFLRRKKKKNTNSNLQTMEFTWTEIHIKQYMITAQLDRLIYFKFVLC